MSYQEILYDVADRVATITLNRPEKLNAWTPVMQAETCEALQGAARDEGVRAIVLTGAGRGFCAGADMGNLNARAIGEPSASAAPAGLRFNFMTEIAKPIIAGINGPVAGVGLCVALFCDIRYIAEGTKLSSSFARRGLIAEHGAAWLLSRQIGMMNALDLLLSGRMIEAAEAARLGLAKLLPAEGFAAALHAAAAEFANLSSPRSMGVIKRQIYDAQSQNLVEATKLADGELLKCRDTEDFREGVAHFMEKRPPRFTGR